MYAHDVPTNEGVAVAVLMRLSVDERLVVVGGDVVVYLSELLMLLWLLHC